MAQTIQGRLLKSAAFLGLALSCTNAVAMPEAAMGTRSDGKLLAKISSTANPTYPELAAEFSKTGVPELDALWASQTPLVSGSCVVPAHNCRAISVFQGKSSNRPVVLLPGFTGYRKMYLEQIYDLLQAGYGPIYISDFTGTGDSVRLELAAGESLKTADSFVKSAINGDSTLSNQIKKFSGSTDPKLLETLLRNVPMGVGYIDNFNTYVLDVDLVMNLAVSQNPGRKIIAIALSMSGLSTVEAIAAQDKNPNKWIQNVDRVILESPMIHTKGTDFNTQIVTKPLALANPTGSVGIRTKPSTVINPYVVRALGIYDPDNSISHSPTRLSMTDAMRLWSGHDTFGASFNWANEDMHHQYATDLAAQLNKDALNHKVPTIAKVLKENNVTLITVASEGDGIVDTSQTKLFVRDLAKSGLTDNTLCLFKTSKHVIDQETDKYRVPYMELIVDQMGREDHKDLPLKATYGTAPEQEVLPCARVGG